MKKGLLFANPKRLSAKFYDPFGIYINEDRHRSICVDSVNQQRTPKIVWDDLVFHDGCRMAAAPVIRFAPRVSVKIGDHLGPDWNRAHSSHCQYRMADDSWREFSEFIDKKHDQHD